jgi:serine phosphatase RsbU (regulator of sigma subunit)/uncharacterized protein HemY
MHRKGFSIFLMLFLAFHLGMNARNDTLKVPYQGADTLKRINSLLKVSRYNAERNPDKTVKYAREALRLSEEMQNEQGIGDSHYYMGYGYYKENKYDSAITAFQQALDVHRRLDNKQELALTYNRLGYTHQMKANFEKALRNYQHALDINKSLEEPNEIARTLTNIGSINRNFGQYDKAIQLYLRALSLYEKTNNQEGIAWTSLNISRLFKLNEVYDKALSYLKEAENIYRSISEKEGLNTGVTLCLKEYGQIYSQSGELDKALNYSRKVLERNRDENNRFGIANSLLSIGKIYLEKEQYEKSLDYLNESLELKKELKDERDIPLILRLMGENFKKQDQYALALRFLKKAMPKAEAQNLKEEQQAIYYSLYEVYKWLGNDSRALDYLVMYALIKEDVNSQKISELELKYEFEKKQEKLKYEQEKENALQKARIKRQNIVMYAFIAGFILLALLLFVIYRNYKVKARANEILEQKNEEIQAQRDEIEAQRDTATSQRDKIARQNRIITESMEYASRIQNAVLPQESLIKDIFSDYFIFFKPKNIVSGDFYWINKIDSKIVLVAADCTGHGVPGAFMSMLGVAFLNEIINQKQIFDPGEILNNLRTNVIDALHQTVKKRGSRDGMDIALAVIDEKTYELQFSGAYNPLYIIRDNELKELKADRMPIGVHNVYQDTSFSVQKEKLLPGDRLYLFSDGYYDQFGGTEGMKFSRKAFKKTLLEIHQKPMAEQEEELNRTLIEWMSTWSQIDDIMVLGFHFEGK